MKKITASLDKLANRLEELGRFADAASLDVISNTLEKMAAYDVKKDPIYVNLSKAADAVKNGRNRFGKGFLQQANMALHNRVQIYKMPVGQKDPNQVKAQNKFEKAAQFVEQALKEVDSNPESALRAITESLNILTGSQSNVSMPSSAPEPATPGVQKPEEVGLIPGYQRYASKKRR